jgi:protocatechuate 3,4-dioxygenase beta subunit
LAVHADHAGCVVKVDPLANQVDRAPLFLTITLKTGFTVSGRVVTEIDGAPATGMRVHAVTEWYDEQLKVFVQGALEEKTSAVVDADGQYKLIGLPAGLYRFRVDSNGTDFAGTAVRDTLETKLSSERPAAQVDFTVNIGGSVFGIISDEAGQPIHRARVSLRPTGGPLESRGGHRDDFPLEDFQNDNQLNESNSSGEYELRGIPLNRAVAMFVRARDVAPAVPFEFTLTPDRRSVRHDVVLMAGSSISGVVLDADDRPMSGVPVFLQPPISEILSGQTMLSLEHEQTDEQGRFHFKNLLAGTYQLRPRDQQPYDAFGGGDDQATRRPGRVEVTVDGKNDATGVTLYSGESSEADSTTRTASGIVVDSEGTPVARALVVIMSITAGQSRSSNDTTDADGRFSMEVKRDCAYSAEVEAAGYSDVRLFDVSVDRDLEIVLSRPATIFGRVQTGLGAPPESFSVQWQRNTAASPTSELMEMIAALDAPSAGVHGQSDGSFKLENVPPGSIQLIVRARGFAEFQSDAIEVAAGAELRDVVLTLSEGALVVGLVTQNGRPFAGAEVQVTRVDDTSEMEQMMRQFAPDMGGKSGVSSDEQGRYVVSGLVAGVYQVRARHDDFTPSPVATVTISADRVYTAPTLELSRGGSIQGVVQGAEHAPRKGMVVQLLTTGNPPAMTTTDAEGKFGFTHLAAGEYTILVMGMDDLQRGRMAMKTRSVTIRDEDIAHITLTCGAGRKVSGQISGVKIKPGQAVILLLPGAPSTQDIDYSNLVAAQQSILRHSAGLGLIAPNGSFEVFDVDPGTYTLEVPATPDNPLDLEAYKTMDRTPVVRRVVVVGDTDLELSISPL